MSSCKVEEETDCMGEYTSPIEPGSNIYNITYPKDIDKDGKMKFKDQTIHRHPETLFADKNSKGRITNLLFSTHQGDKWLKVFCGHYKFHPHWNLKVSMKLQVRNEKKDPIWLTIHIYDNGKVMLQGTEERLRDFAKIFMNLKEKASSEDVNDVLATVESDNRGKITSFFPKTGSKCLSKTDKCQGDNTGNQKEEGANKQEEENVFTEDESNGRERQRDCAGNEEGEKSKVKKEEKATNLKPYKTESNQQI